MKISSTENIDLHDKLFKNWDNYDKWAPFLIEFQQQYNSKCKGVPAVLGPTFSICERRTERRVFSVDKYKNK